jgi:hypothetical protein
MQFMLVKSCLILVAFLFATAAAQLDAASQFVITEFMAANSSTITDEDGAYSDWVEIYNTGATSANIGGWYLTDNAGNLTKWQFPATNIAPHSFIIVWASSKNKRVPGAPLHANFSLSAGGEYLALVQPDGVTIAAEFQPAEQFNDVAFGYLMAGTETKILAASNAAVALVPSADIGNGWRSIGFDDSTWSAGTTGVGYDRNTNYLPGIGLNVGTAMSNVNASAYIRVPFTVVDPSIYEGLALRMRYDDGFVAYLNGTEIARRNAPASPAFNSQATGPNGPPAPGSLVQNFDAGVTNYTLNQFRAAPAPAVQVAGAGSTGNYLRLLHDTFNDVFNSCTFARTAPGLFQTITADFDFRMANSANNPADGWTFMLIPTSVYGTNGQGINFNGIGVEEPNFAGVFAVGVDVYPHGTQNDVSVHWNASEKLNVTMPRPAYELVNNQFHHMKVILQHVAGGARVTVTLTMNVNGSPSAPYTPIDNLFVAGLNPYDCRVQFGARTGGLNHALDLDNINVQFTPGELAYENFDVTAATSLLVPGTNVLAIQGLNASPSDSDFLIVPELVASDFVVGTNANYISPATPRTWNNVSGAGTVADVSFSLPSGAYSSNSLSVALATASSSSQIRYTLNGANPTASSLLYTGAITISVNTVIRARAFELGKVDGEITAANYVLVDSTLTNFTSNLPLVIIDSLGGSIVAETKIPTYVVMINNNGPNGRTRWDGQFDYRGRAGVELHGQSSLGFPKQSMNLETDTEGDKDKEVSLLGLPKESDWVLYAPYTDKTLMNDYLTYELHEAMGHYAVRRKFVEVFVRTTAGKLNTADYRGVYVFLEKIRINEKRVNISKPQTGAPGDPITGGYIFKRDKPSPGMVEFTTPTQPYTGAANGVSMQFHDPRGDELNPAQLAWLPARLTEFENVAYGPNWRDPLYGYLRYIDADSFVDQHWIVEFPKNIDGYRLSDYMHIDRGGKIKMEPIWDWNLSWGNANYLEGGLTNNWYHPLLGGGDDIWLGRLRMDPDFYQRIIDRWGQLRTNVFALSNLLGRVERITNELAEAQARDHVRWPRLSAYVWPNPDGANLVPSGTDGVALNWDVNYATPGSYTALIGEMKKWITGRQTWVDRQFLLPPTLSRAGGPIVPGTTLTMTSVLGSVYYTMDGTDPRASGGGISPSAILYNGGTLTLSNNAGVFARALYTNRWSSPARQTFVVTPPALTISEIMYHPADPATNSIYSEDDFEYIEIKNTGATTLNLSGARLAGGIDFTFAPSTLIPTGAPTSNSFSPAGTPYTAARLNSGGAPDSAGGFLRLVHNTTNLVRNRIAFDQTASGNYGRIVADFDFRATTAGTPAFSGAPTLQDFEGAPGSSNYVLSGSAAYTTLNPGSSGNFMRIVPATPVGLSGGIGFERTATGGWNTVVASFDFRITPGTGQADGMAVAFLNTATYGTNGAAPGMSEEPNLTGTIGIGIDDYSNAEVNNNHVSLHYGAIVGAPVTPSFDLSNSRFHRAQVIIRFSGGRALVTLRITPDINVAPGVTETLLQDAVINGVNPYEMRLAFGARTGGESAAHDIDNVSVQYLSSTETTAGLSLQLLPTGTFGATGAGSTLAHFTDSPTLTNGLSLDLAFHPSNYLNDASIFWNASRVAGSWVPTSSLDLDNGLFNHVRLTVDTYAGGAYVTAVLTPDSLGTPGTPVVLASNLFIAGLNPGNWRLELAGRNGLIDTALDVDNVKVSYFTFDSLTLAPGECILVVKNRAAFESRYGTSYRIAGEYSGQLDNSGDHIVLLGPVGEPLLDFTYSDDWYRLTDGLGFSLVNVGTNYNSNSGWRNSTYQNGSPGAVDPVVTIAPVVINEVVANTIFPATDRIELFNPTTNNVNIGGWFLTDDFNSPQKFRIPNGTILSNGGFIVFTEADFNPDPGMDPSFALSADGDEIYLFSGDANTNLTGYVHGFDFAGSEEGVSFGRLVDSNGEEHYPAQTANTFGAANAGPRVGPVVISEIMYRPASASSEDNSDDEFIELLNIDAAAVPLYSTALPTDTWHLRDGIDFDFPESITMSAGERILVVNFNPTNAARADAFRAKFGVSPGVRLFGPYEGKLDNSSDDIHLNKPLPPGTNETIYARVDQVHYKDSKPWPAAADGYGASLHRLALSAYGDDPSNWLAASASPGAAYAGGVAPAITLQPSDITILGGKNTNFTAAATGPSLNYQWRVNGTNILHGTNATLFISNIQLTDAGAYKLAVFNTAGSQVSSNANLIVVPPVVFTLHPTNQKVLPGTNVTMVASAVGFGPITYQWMREGVPIPNATNATYSFTGASLETHHGYYSVSATDGFSTSVSSNALIFVAVPPGFVITPVPQTILAGQSVTITALATGAPPIWYRFLRAGVLQPPNDTGVLILSNVTANFNIRVFATNWASSATGVQAPPSAGVTITVLADADRDGMADTWETNYFGAVNTTNNSANALQDPDNDGMINRDEYIAGTNPTNALSVLKLFTANTNTALQFVAQTNISYSVQYRSTISSTNWTTVTNVASQPSNVRTVNVNTPNPPPDVERYYRVVTPQVQ